MTCRGAHQRGILGSHTRPLYQQFLITQLHPVQPRNSLRIGGTMGECREEVWVRDQEPDATPEP